MISLPTRLTVLLLGLCFACGCSNGAAVRASIHDVSAITVFEGLPHQDYERELFEAEKKTKPTIDQAGFQFYEETVSLKATDQAKIKSLLSAPESFGPFTSGKKCGSFHPDFAVEWSVNGRKVLGLVCFGCSEYRITGASGTFYWDLPDQVRTQLKDVLAPYHHNRPEHEYWGVWKPD